MGNSSCYRPRPVSVSPRSSPNGPSTPLSPVLFEHGVTILSSAQIVDEAAARRTIGQGATFQQVEGAKLLTFINETEK